MGCRRAKRNPGSDLAGAWVTGGILPGQLGQDVVWIRVLAGFLLGVDNPVSNCYLMHASAGRDEGYRFNLVLLIVEYQLRQTGGFCKVSSGGAVFDSDFSLVSHVVSFIHSAAAGVPPSSRTYCIYSSTPGPSR